MPQKPKIKLLALDLDGTLLNPHGEVSDANRQAIRDAEDLGVLVTIATGRRFRDALPVARTMEFNAPLVTHNGALLKFAGEDEPVSAELLDHDVALDAIKIGKGFGGDALISTDPAGDGALLYERISADNIPLQHYVRWAKRLHGDEAEAAIYHVPEIENAVADHEVIHISYSGSCVKMRELTEILLAELGTRVKLLSTIYPQLDFTLIDILPPNASKGTGVGKLASMHGIAKNEIMVVGDNHNDLEMLEFAGTPVLMGNAHPSLLDRVEFYKTLGNEDDGVAAAIERFILN